MAGLCAAARARELGLEVVVHEKGVRPGGSMLLSSCVVWRYLDLDAFREECPGGDPELQRQVIERLDEGLQWLRSLGAEVVWEETGNPRTVGVRFDPRSLTEVLVRAAGEVRLGETAPEDAAPTLLATGGFQGDRDLVRLSPYTHLTLPTN
jgi:NADPH-dependent 2,4-dienoyl-CoA reductase/sulfur reductase-like enzyme